MKHTPERRPRYRRPCPLAEQEGCDWWQVTEWWVGGPELSLTVSQQYLMAEAEAHLLHAHVVINPQVFDLKGR
jgi:hypothetical protein